MTSAALKGPGSGFHPTRWTLVMEARGDSLAARAALSDLCAAYWRPVFEFLVREGRTEDEGQELAQEFFARLLARGSIGDVDPIKGRFRSYVLGALKHFLQERRRNQQREKRGGLVGFESMDAPGQDASPGLQVADPNSTAPEMEFDREWAQAIMARGLASVQSSFVKAGKGAQFEVLKPWLAGNISSLSQAEAATELGLSTGAVKVIIHRMRKELRLAVESEIAQTVASPEDIAGELRHLVDVLS